MRQQTSYPVKYIRINIPEYTLRFFAQDSLKRTHRVIVGKPENPTPELSSKIIRMVAYPFWNVPYSIASKEILPSVKHNLNYLEKNNYKIYRGEQEINPRQVNWSRIKENTFPYKIVQQPGEDNSLGILKFEFHSNYSVYLHDTPTKHLFKSDIRAFSHGCMRCEEPLELGKALLDYDSLKLKRNHLTCDSLDSLMLVAKHFPFKLLDPVPIYVEYVTVCADRERLIFYPDIYGRDELYLKLFKAL
jgi:murein L,D-transpeptidase YcbB/YkuD